MNADGTAGVPAGCVPRPIFDTASGYPPVNGPPAGVTALTRWAPLVEDLTGAGTYTTQTVMAAQATTAGPVLVPPRTLRRMIVPPPYRSPSAYVPDFDCDCLGRGARGGSDRDDPYDLFGRAWAVVAAGGNALTTT